MPPCVLHINFNLLMTVGFVLWMEWDSFIRVIYNPTSIYFRQIEIIGRLKLIRNLQVRDLTALSTKYDTSVKLWVWGLSTICYLKILPKAKMMISPDRIGASWKNSVVVVFFYIKKYESLLSGSKRGEYNIFDVEYSN